MFFLNILLKMMWKF